MPRIAAALLVGLVVIGGLGGFVATTSDGATSDPVTTAAHCVATHGSGPGYDGSSGNKQNRQTVCVTTGKRLLVLLTAPQLGAAPWRSVHVSKAGVLKIAPLTLMLTRGTTGTNFEAVRPGTVTLESQRSACAPAPSGGAACGAIEHWQSTVVVRAPVTVRPPAGVGVYGIVTASPTCPVEQVGQPCPPRPVSAEVHARDANGQIVASTHTDTVGHYAINTSPGRYTVTVTTGGGWPRCPSTGVTVPPGSAVRTDIGCDTGIR
jgi:hypothetical protein